MRPDFLTALRAAVKDTPDGLVSLYLRVEGGRVTDYAVRSRNLELERLMRGVPCRREAEVEARKGRRG